MNIKQVLYLRVCLNWSTSYRLCRSFGLSPEQKSFLWKMSNNILVTRERLHKVRKADTATCVSCPGLTDDTEHLLTCVMTSEVTARLTRCVTCYIPAASATDIIHLNLDITESLELPIVWLIATILQFVYLVKADGRIARLPAARAELLARVAVLSHARKKNYTILNSNVIINDIILNFFS